MQRSDMAARVERQRDRDHDQINLSLAKQLNAHVPEQLNRVLAAGSGDIELMFLGFVDTYEALSKIIPLDWTVVDLGCAYAPQAYYFRHHAKYVGVDLGIMEPVPGDEDRHYTPRFSFANTEHHVAEICDFIRQNLTKFSLRTTFAICNYVPNQEASKAIREAFPNCYVYYPASVKPSFSLHGPSGEK